MDWLDESCEGAAAIAFSGGLCVALLLQWACCGRRRKDEKDKTYPACGPHEATLMYENL